MNCFKIVDSQLRLGTEHLRSGVYVQVNEYLRKLFNAILAD